MRDRLNILNRAGIAVSTGHDYAQPTRRFGLESTVCPSPAF